MEKLSNYKTASEQYAAQCSTPEPNKAREGVKGKEDDKADGQGGEEGGDRDKKMGAKGQKKKGKKGRK